MQGSDADSRQLDNPVWFALHGPHARFAESDSSGRVVRYHPAISIFGAVDRLDSETWAAQAEFAGPGGVAVLFRDEVPAAPAGWTEEFRAVGLQMVAGGLQKASSLDTVALGAADADEMLALTQLTEPGPFLARTFELGGYRGVRRDGRLVAMAGERFRVAGWTEISAVCTHPDARREGLGASLTLALAERIAARGERAFLHVLAHNENALRLYQALGFAFRRRVDVLAARWGEASGPT